MTSASGVHVTGSQPATVWTSSSNQLLRDVLVLPVDSSAHELGVTDAEEQEGQGRRLQAGPQGKA